MVSLRSRTQTEAFIKLVDSHRSARITAIIDLIAGMLVSCDYVMPQAWLSALFRSVIPVGMPHWFLFDDFVSASGPSRDLELSRWTKTITLPSSLTPSKSKPAVGSVYLPPELLSNITEYLYTDNYGQPCPLFGSDPGLLACSLVCFTWAQHCRKMLYSGKTLRIKSRKEAERFIELMKSGKTLPFTPIVDLLATLGIVSNSFEPYPWLHILFSPFIPAVKLTWMTIRGTGEDLGCSLWDLPRSLPSSATPYTHIKLRNCYFGTNRDVMQFTRRFARAKHLDFWNVTWDQDPLRALAPRPFGRNLSQTIDAVTTHGCTDNALLCLQSIGIGTDMGDLRDLPAADQVALHDMVRYVESAYDEASGAHVGVGVSCELRRESQGQLIFIYCA